MAKLCGHLHFYHFTELTAETLNHVMNYYYLFNWRCVWTLFYSFHLGLFLSLPVARVFLSVCRIWTNSLLGINAPIWLQYLIWSNSVSQADTVADADGIGEINTLSLGSVTVVTRPDVCGRDCKEFLNPATLWLLLPVFAFLWDVSKPVGAVSYLDKGAEEKLFLMERVHLVSSASEWSCSILRVVITKNEKCRLSILAALCVRAHKHDDVVWLMFYTHTLTHIERD